VSRKKAKPAAEPEFGLTSAGVNLVRAGELWERFIKPALKYAKRTAELYEAEGDPRRAHLVRFASIHIHRAGDIFEAATRGEALP
jgi:hypothetical protein